MTRRRYRYDEELKAMVEIDPEWTDTPRRAPVATEGITYSNLQATDGTPIDSRRKHREYMKANNVTLSSDFKETWAAAATQREKYLQGDFDHRGRREDIARALERPRRKR